MLVILRRSSVYHLRNFRISFGQRIENLMNLCSDCFAIGQQKIDLLSQLRRITARSSPHGRELPFEMFLLLTQSLGQFNRAVDLVFEVREFFESVGRRHCSLRLRNYFAVIMRCRARERKNKSVWVESSESKV